MSEQQPDLRQRIDRVLDQLTGEPELKETLELVLATTKQARGWCPNCRKQVHVEIPDAKAVVGAIAELANQAKGRPDVAAQADQDRVVFERVVYMGEHEPSDL